MLAHPRSIDQQTRRALRHLAHEPGERHYRERRPEDEEEPAVAKVGTRAPGEARGQFLAKEGDCRLDQPARLLAQLTNALLAAKYGALHGVDVDRRAGADDVRGVKVAVRGDHHLPWQTRRRFQRVYVLREAALQLAMLVQLA